MFVGKSQPWTSEGATSDSLPPSPVDALHQNHIIGMICFSKLIGASNTTFAIPRRNFSTSSAFDMYRHDVSEQRQQVHTQQKQQHQVVQQVCTIYILLYH